LAVVGEPAVWSAVLAHIQQSTVNDLGVCRNIAVPRELGLPTRHLLALATILSYLRAVDALLNSFQATGTRLKIVASGSGNILPHRQLVKQDDLLGLVPFS
jgi:hypothetical protein